MKRSTLSRRLWLYSCLSIPAIILLSSYMHSVNLSGVDGDAPKIQLILDSATHKYNGLHDDVTKVPEFQLTALLQVTPESVCNLVELLTPFQGQSQLREVILLCPQAIAPDVRFTLGDMISSSDDWPDITLEITSGSSDSEVDLIEVASGVSTEWVLLMDHQGLSQLTSTSRDILLSPPAIPLPYGPRGICLSLYNISELCALRLHERSRPVSYLLPPFVMPTYLATFPHNDRVHSWISLGEHIAVSHGNGSGGLIFGTSDIVPPRVSKHGATLAYDHNHHFSGQRRNYDNETRLEPNQDLVTLRDQGIFVILLPDVEDFRSISALLCRLQNHGNVVYTYIYDEAETGSSDETLHYHATGDCELTYMSLTSSRTLRPLRVEEWLGAMLSINVIIARLSNSAFFHALDNSVRNVHNEAVIVQLSQDDLPHSEWMGLLSLNEWHNWNVPRLDISVITQDRPKSVARLITSLSNALFFGDTVDLRVNVDQSADLETLKIVENISWSRGAMFVHRRVIHGGLLPAVVESWYPRSNDTYGLLLEDDVELSPLFYAWAKMTLLRYRYGNANDRSPKMFGISLYQQKIVELPLEGRRPFDAPALFSTSNYFDRYTPYLSPIPCSWGAIYFPEHWKEFHSYLSIRLSESSAKMSQIIVPNVRSNKWTKSWKKYFIELAYLRGYVMLYPNFPNFVSLSTNHLEVGSHVKVRTKEKQNLFMVPLMQLSESTVGLLQLPNATLPAWRALPVLNLTGALTTLEALIETGNERRRELTSSVIAPAQFDAEDLLRVQDTKPPLH